MKSRIKIITKLSIVLIVLMMPITMFAQPGPPPPPEGIPFDLVSGLILAGAALYSGTKFFFNRGAV